MVMLVTLEEAKAQINQILDVDDELIMSDIEAASACVLNYLDDRAPEVDSSGEIPDVRPEVKKATLLLLGIFYRDRDGQTMSDWTDGYLPRPVVSLLYPLRDPTLA